MRPFTLCLLALLLPCVHAASKMQVGIYGILSTGIEYYNNADASGKSQVRAGPAKAHEPGDPPRHDHVQDQSAFHPLQLRQLESFYLAAVF